MVVKIHESLDKVLNSLVGKNVARNSFDMRQDVVKRDGEETVIVYWSFGVDQVRTCEMILRLTIVRESEELDDGEVMIKVSSVEETDLDEDSISALPANSSLRLILDNGVILLRPLPLGQTSFAFTSEIALKGQSALFGTANSFSRPTNTNAGLTTMAKNVVTTSENAEDLYSRIANIFYERFKQENVIDQRQKEDFIKNIPTAPPLTDGERAIIKRHMDFYETMRLKAARIGGTVNESVEKFFHRESKVPWGLSVAICDVPAVSIFADLWLLNTYAKKAFNKGTAVLEVFENLDGTRSLCYVKSFGLPGGFQDRLFETWITWDMWVDEFTGKKTCIIVIHPFDAYAGEFRPQVFMNEKFIKADSTGTYIFKELTDNTCEWTWLQNADLNIARMPKNLLDFLTKSQLGWANEVQEQYKRNGRKVDRERVAALAKTMLSMQGVPLQQDQAEIFQRCLELFKGGGDEGWTLLKSPSPNVEMSMKYIKSSGGFGTRTIAMARGKCVIDCSAEEMAAWVMDVCSNNSMRMSREEGHPARIRLRGGNFDRVNEATLATIKRMPLTFDNREFVYRHIWKSEEGKVIIAFESVEEDLVVDYACEEFRQDEKMDRALVMDRATYLKDNWENEVYSEEENGLLKRAQEKFESGLMGRWKSLRSPDPFVAMDWVFDEGACHIVGRAVCILDAPLEYCAANELARDARGRYKEYFDFGGLDRKLVKVNNHCDIYHLVIDFGNGISPREFLTKCVWKRLDEKTLIVGFEDTDDVEFPIGSVGGQRGKYVRASAKSFWKYERLPDVEGVPQTKVMYCQMVDLRGSIPKLASHSASKIVDALAYVSRMRLKFDKSVEIDARRRAKIVTMIAEEPIDVEKGEEYLNEFETMFKDKAGCERPKRVYGGNLSLNRVIATKMDCLEEKEAIQIGKNLIASLKSKKLVDAGVDVWKNQNRAVKELSEKYEWLEPMTVVISKGIVKTAAWGLLWRVTLGAVLSITDLVTDIMVLKLFSDGGEAMHVFRNLSIFSLTFSLILLLLTVFYQHSNHGPLRIMKETVIVLIGMKAPWDAYKVAMGAEQEKGAQFDPMMELAISKCVELFAESIPSILIQTSAVIKTLQSGDQISSTALFSLLISVLTTGYVSATLSYDFDTDPKKRAFNPEFYGYVPDFPTKRALLFFTLINLSAVQVLIKSIFVALLGYLGSLYLVVYMAADMFLFLCYKLARRDMNCWLPMEDNIGSKTLFIFLRMMVKLIVDFTGCVQFRHPFELGGLYYSINLFTPLIGLGLLLAFVDMGGAFNDSVVKTLSNFTLLLGAGLVLLAALFLLLMSKKYRHTFFSVETGKQMTMRTFLHGDDYTRSLIFGTNKSHWIDIEDKVAQWLQFGWYRWEDERPDWFTDEWREIVPAKYKPKMSMRQMRKEKKMLENESEEEKRSEDKFKTNTRKSSVGGERRRSLLGAIFAGEATAGLEIVGNSGGGGGGWGG
ncbi:hypothetical protein TL16_g12337 [Triparma laevis f. inornata]|uniref:Uncharacterized protein n=1 Tax=Triparma laevis f. inornata TaxID=1714386 RepID=A0A9W7EWH0_9STRA|nr:hypothetical protein TL16_g12337 [Triparma laevis f. inornata]